MASYHFTAKIIGRSAGRSAVAAAAYRSGQKLERIETGETHDYTRKSGIVSTEILAPDGAPEWVRDRSQLWNRVEAKESRSNSQLAREFELALPHELSPAEAQALVREWAQENLVDKGMVVDLAIHDPEPVPGRSRNRHVHLMTTTRGLDPSTADGWAKNKDRSWNSDDQLLAWRESWAVAQNRALERAGSKARVDHRSLEAQAEAARAEGRELAATRLDRPPEPRLGVAATAIEKRAARALGQDYRPVTERGQMLAQFRSLRSGLVRAVIDLGREARDLMKLAKRLGLPAREPVPVASPLAPDPARVQERREQLLGLAPRPRPRSRPEPERDRGRDDFDFGR
jgi:hypothetical protein